MQRILLLHQQQATYLTILQCRTDPLNTALRNFESSLSTQQRTDLRAVNATPDANAVIAFTAQIDEENASRRSRGVANRLYQSLESIQQFTSIVDTFVQANPQIAALVWGSFKVAILVGLGIPNPLSMLKKDRLPKSLRRSTSFRNGS